MNKYIYEILETLDGGNVLKRTDADGLEAWVPFDESNSDYQAYLESIKPVEKPKSK